MKKKKQQKRRADLVVEIETEHALVTIVATEETGRKLAVALEKIGENLPLLVAGIQRGMQVGTSFVPNSVLPKN